MSEVGQPFVQAGQALVQVGPEEAVEAEGVVEQEVLEEKEGKTFLTFSTLVDLQ